MGGLLGWSWWGAIVWKREAYDDSTASTHGFQACTHRFHRTSRLRDLCRLLVGCSISYEKRLLRLPGQSARVLFASDPGCSGTPYPAACPTGWRPTCPPDQVRVFQGTFLPIRRPLWRRAASAFGARLTGVACTSTRSPRSRCSSAWSRLLLPTRIGSSSAGWSVRLRCRWSG